MSFLPKIFKLAILAGCLLGLAFFWLKPAGAYPFSCPCGYECYYGLGGYDCWCKTCSSLPPLEGEKPGSSSCVEDKVCSDNSIRRGFEA